MRYLLTTLLLLWTPTLFSQHARAPHRLLKAEVLKEKLENKKQPSTSYIDNQTPSLSKVLVQSADDQGNWEDVEQTFYSYTEGRLTSIENQTYDLEWIPTSRTDIADNGSDEIVTYLSHTGTEWIADARETNSYFYDFTQGTRLLETSLIENYYGQWENTFLDSVYYEQLSPTGFATYVWFEDRWIKQEFSELKQIENDVEEIAYIMDGETTRAMYKSIYLSTDILQLQRSIEILESNESSWGFAEFVYQLPDIEHYENTAIAGEEPNWVLVEDKKRGVETDEQGRIVRSRIVFREATDNGLEYVMGAEITFDALNRVSTTSFLVPVGMQQFMELTRDEYIYAEENLERINQYVFGSPLVTGRVLFTYSTTTSIDEPNPISSSFALGAAYPNPFNPSTTVPYSVHQTAHITLSVYDALGRQIATLVNGVQSAGEYTMRFDASGLNSGVYLVRLQSGAQVQTSRLTLIK